MARSGQPVSRVGKLAPILTVGLALAVKGFISSISIWGFDFLYTVKAILYPHPLPASKTYWVYINQLLYRLWLRLPIEHTDLTSWMGLKVFPLTWDFCLLTFMLKLPILLLDAVCGLLVYGIALTGSDESTARRSLYLWIWNPYVTLTAEMMGTNDLFPTALTLLTVLLVIRREWVKSSLSAFASVASKFYPLLIIPVLAIHVREARRAAVILVSSSAGVVAYFYWVWRSLGSNFHLTLLEYSPLTYHVSELLISPRSDLNIGLATFSSILFLYLIYRFWNSGETVNAILTFLLAYFAFANWWPQYLLMIMPFMALKAGCNKRWLLYSSTITITAFFISLLSFNLSGEIHLFYITNYYGWMREASAVLQRLSTDVVAKLVLQPVLRSIYACLSIYYAAKLLVENSRLSKFLGGRSTNEGDEAI
jgi:hypothetical protein